MRVAQNFSLNLCLGEIDAVSDPHKGFLFHCGLAPKDGIQGLCPGVGGLHLRNVGMRGLRSNHRDDAKV